MIKCRTKWNIKNPNEESIKNIIKTNKLSGLIARVLSNKGFTDSEEINMFLNPDICNLHSPFLLKDMDKAVEIIHQHIQKKEKILIYGDYDADGVTSTAVLYDYLKREGTNVFYYIPDRSSDGYGLNMESLERISISDYSLVITVDNGISAIEEIKHIRDLGVDVVVTDHHECGEIIPKANAVINPKRDDCEYPFKFLAGVGVTFKLVCALAETTGNFKEVFERYIEIVCIGTIGDIVQLTGENRIIVKYGLGKISNSSNLGIKALCEESGITKFSTWAISFMIVPRINAAGRLGGAERAVELFTTSDREIAKNIACELGQENRNRQEIEADVLNQVLDKIEKDNLQNKSIIIIGGEGWHHGVVGIVASRVVDRFNKPCIIASFEDESGRGSGRSLEGVNLFEVLSACSCYLEKFGGHELAGGITISRKNFEAFREKAEKIVDSITEGKTLIKSIEVEDIIDIKNLEYSAVNDLALLEPFGMGNPAPIFCIENAEIASIRTVGDNKHLKLSINRVLELEGSFNSCQTIETVIQGRSTAYPNTLRGGGISGDRHRIKSDSKAVEAIGFQMGELKNHLKVKDKISLVFSAEISLFAGKNNVQMIIKDLYTTSEVEHEEKYFETLDIRILSCEYKIDALTTKFIQMNRDNETINEFIKSGSKNLFLINTIGVYRHVISILGTQDLNSDVEIRYNDDKGALARNVFIVNPILEEIDLSAYNKVILCDAFFRAEYYGTINNKSKKISVYVLYQKDDIKYNLEVLENIKVDRKHLEAVYRLIKKYSRDNVLKLSQSELFKILLDEHGLTSNSFLLRQSLEIFQDISLIKSVFENDVINITLIPTDGGKANLEDSNLYRIIANCVNDFNNNAKKIISMTFTG